MSKFFILLYIIPHDFEPKIFIKKLFIPPKLFLLTTDYVISVTVN
jgi:hypothetical protein